MPPPYWRRSSDSGPPAASCNASEAAGARAGIPAAAREFLRHAAAEPGARRTTNGCGSERHHLLPFTDPRYPKLLRSLPDCPIALYVAGSIDALGDPQLAVVGSRNPTPQGRDIAFDFAHDLAQRGLAITSGLAQGIDAAAHRGALAAQGITVAVLGNGIDVVYPRGNRDLSRDHRAARRPGQRISAGHRSARAPIFRGAIASSRP